MAGVPALGFKIVGQHVARNPIARAINRARLRQAALDCQIELYVLDDGADVTGSAMASSKTLAVALGVLTDAGQLDSTSARVIAGGMSCLAQCSQRGFRWRSIDAPAVDQALKHAVEIYNRAGAQQVEQAWLRVDRLEREASAMVQTSVQGAQAESSPFNTPSIEESA